MADRPPRTVKSENCDQRVACRLGAKERLFLTADLLIRRLTAADLLLKRQLETAVP